jgi:hypothetical protein
VQAAEEQQCGSRRNVHPVLTAAARAGEAASILIASRLERLHSGGGSWKSLRRGLRKSGVEMRTLDGRPAASSMALVATAPLQRPNGIYSAHLVPGLQPRNDWALPGETIPAMPRRQPPTQLLRARKLYKPCLPRQRMLSAMSRAAYSNHEPGLVRRCPPVRTVSCCPSKADATPFGGIATRVSEGSSPIPNRKRTHLVHQRPRPLAMKRADGSTAAGASGSTTTTRQGVHEKK